MTQVKKVFLVSTAIFLGLSLEAHSIPPKELFKHKWSEVCATSHNVETSEYLIFHDSEYCEYFVDTFRVQSICTPASFKAMDGNRVSMTLKENKSFIIEFLWASQISIMEIISQKPFTLEQRRTLGIAKVRDNLLTHYLYCP